MTARLIRGVPLFWNHQNNLWVEGLVDEPLDDLEALSSAAEHLDAADVVTLFKAFARWECRLGNWGVVGEDRKLVCAYLELILNTVPLPVDVLGTCWRFLRLKTSHLNLRNPNCPVELQAAKLLPLLSIAQVQEAEMARWVTKYPEVADLPHELAAQVVSSQPVPEEWFHDVFPLPETVEWLAPDVRRGDHA